MIRVPTVSAERETQGLAPFEEFVDLLAELYPQLHAGLQLERFDGFGLVYTWASSGSALDPVVLMAHYDVVPVTGQEAEWSVPPFEGRVADGKVWGRGTLDDKGALCVLLEAVENLVAEGWTPPRPVLLCLGPDEEVMGATARLIAATYRDRGVRPWLVLDEGGAITEVPFPGVDGHFAMVGLAEKGVLSVELNASGQGGHASATTGITAVGRIARVVAKLNRNPFDVRMPRTVIDLLGKLAAHAQPKYARLWRLAARNPGPAARALLAGGGADGAALVRTSLAPTMLSGGSSPNVLPSAASATLNIRVNVGETTTGVIARLRRVINDPLVAVRVLEGDEPTPESPSDNAQFALIAQAVEASYPGTPTLGYLTMAATDARHWHRFTSAVYRFAPLRMSAAQRAAIHGIDESVDIDSLVRGEQFYRALLLNLPGGES
ncbi:MAG TPA: M20/M25/M40 family metallo-hydrolase [Propionicimonas sp.]|nr:M20/M25/M40 family metallo-hydrolase [Propionicimonas sp.]HQA78714.1 M20/M25/M40 family metallo-hydrolase [Propionicimonas sp.]HQD97902.1 M20/M25/M40 family metallo-hydrolase [Propionicimonas sp.]